MFLARRRDPARRPLVVFAVSSAGGRMGPSATVEDTGDGDAGRVAVGAHASAERTFQSDQGCSAERSARAQNHGLRRGSRAM